MASKPTPTPPVTELFRMPDQDDLLGESGITGGTAQPISPSEPYLLPSIPPPTAEQPQPTPPVTGLFYMPTQDDLPDSDGEIVENFQEHPQSILLTTSIRPWLEQLHPDGKFIIGQNNGIYWDLTTARSDTPVRGAIAPDWFYIPNVPQDYDQRPRRSYVLWHDRTLPLIVLEFVSRGKGRKERSRTPFKGKMWIYENIGVRYYGIFDVRRATLDVYMLEDGAYTPLLPNAHDRYPIPEMQVELGLWRGSYLSKDVIWLRWWALAGEMLPTGEERAEQEAARAAAERERAEQEAAHAKREYERAERLAARLREAGIDPDA